MKNLYCNALLLCSLLLWAFSLQADDIITIESTISGSQEQPKILVIIPWQKPDEANMADTTDDSDPASHNPYLQPLERRAFMEKTQWLEQLQP